MGGGVALGHGVSRRISGEGPAVGLVAEAVFRALHVGVAPVLRTEGVRAEEGDEPVVGQVLVCHGHVVGGQCVAPVRGVSGECLEDANACARGRSPTEFGGVEELPFRTHASAVEQAAFVEQVSALQEEGTVLVKAHFVRAEVEHEVVGDHLAKVRDQGHVHGECIADADLGVKTTIDGRNPLSVALVIHGGRRVGADVGEQGDSRGCPRLGCLEAHRLG